MDINQTWKANGFLGMEMEKRIMLFVMTDSARSSFPLSQCYFSLCATRHAEGWQTALMLFVMKLVQFPPSSSVPFSRHETSASTQWAETGVSEDTFGAHSVSMFRLMSQPSLRIKTLREYKVIWIILERTEMYGKQEGPDPTDRYGFSMCWFNWVRSHFQATLSHKMRVWLVEDLHLHSLLVI